MVHLHRLQYKHYQEILSMIEMEIKRDIPSEQILDRILIKGQEGGFCKQEMWQMIDLCLDENRTN